MFRDKSRRPSGWRLRRQRRDPLRRESVDCWWRCGLRGIVPAYVRCERSGEHSRGFHPGGKTHSQEWLCHVPSTSCWAKVFGVPLGLAWRKFRSSRPSGTQYLRMCVVNAVGNIQGASRWAAKAHSQEWLCHVPSTSCWAKVFGVPLGLAWGKFRSSRPSGTHCTCVCALWRR